MSRFTELNRRAIGHPLNWIGAFFLIISVLPLPAIAEYIPPTERSAPSGSTTTTGTRGGCKGDSPTSLTALAPSQYQGQTTQSHPLFMWHVPEQSTAPLTFQLYALTSTGKQLQYTTQIQSQPGLMQWSLPEAEPGLVPGRSYFWQVVLLCDPNSPSTALLAGADIQAIASPPSLSAQLATAQAPEERATLYAQSGFWYDALAEVAAPQFAPQRQQFIQELATLERSDGTLSETEQDQRLQEILESGQLSRHSRN